MILNASFDLNTAQFAHTGSNENSEGGLGDEDGWEVRMVIKVMRIMRVVMEVGVDGR